MTLILNILTDDCVYAISDRRITSFNGKHFDDDSNKAIVYTLADARLAVSYSGLAYTGEFRTREWLVSALRECAGPDFQLHSTLERIAQAVGKRFREDDIRRETSVNRRLTIRLAGYVYRESETRICLVNISNFESAFFLDSLQGASDDFVCEPCVSAIPVKAILIACAGRGDLVRQTEFDSLANMIHDHSTSAAILSRAVALIRRVAAGEPTIGNTCTSIIIPQDRRRFSVSAAHRERSNGGIVEGADIVRARWKNDDLPMIGLRMELRGPDGRLLANAHSAGRPNEKCWCGSGRKHRKCHGRPA